MSSRPGSRTQFDRGPQPRTGRRRLRGFRPWLETLEARVVPSTLPAPNPIDPTRGASTLLRVVQAHADRQTLNAQDHFPVPYVLSCSAGGAAWEIALESTAPAIDSTRVRTVLPGMTVRLYCGASAR